MNRTVARLIFLLPLLLVFVLFGWSLLDDRSTWPVAAQEYLYWFRSQPAETALAFSSLGLLGVIALILSTIGLVLFWPPARYLYLVSAVLALMGDIPTIPILVSAPGYVLNQASTLALGVTVTVIFFGPANKFFERDVA